MPLYRRASPPYSASHITITSVATHPQSATMTRAGARGGCCFCPGQRRPVKDSRRAAAAGSAASAAPLGDDVDALPKSCAVRCRMAARAPHGRAALGRSQPRRARPTAAHGRSQPRRTRRLKSISLLRQPARARSFISGGGPAALAAGAAATESRCSRDPGVAAATTTARLPLDPAPHRNRPRQRERGEARLGVSRGRRTATRRTRAGSTTHH